MTERLSDKNPCIGCKRPAYYCDRCEDYSTYFDNLVEKLKKYETAEEEGRLVVLPCKIGTRVYEIYQFCGCGAWEIEEHKIKLEDLDKIGKTVFLTEEEAEKELREMEKDDAAN